MESFYCSQAAKNGINALNKQGFKALKNKGLTALAVALATTFAVAVNDNARAQSFEELTRKSPELNEKSMSWKAGQYSKDGEAIGLYIVKGQKEAHVPDETIEQYWKNYFLKEHGLKCKAFIKRGEGYLTLYGPYIMGSNVWGRLRPDEFKKLMPKLVNAQNGALLLKEKKEKAKTKAKAEASTKQTIEYQ